MKSPRIAIWAAALGAVVLVMLVLAAVLLPRLVDSQLMQERISSALAKKSQGRFSFGKIAVLWFPRPTVVIERAEISFEQKAHGSIPTTKIYPSIFYLLTGRLVVRRALLQEPKITVHLPEISAKRIDLEAVEKQIRSVLVRFATELSAPRVELSDGWAEVAIGDKPPFILEKVWAQAITTPAELSFHITGRSNLCERLRVEGKISPESLASQLEIAIQRLKLEELLTLLPPQISEYARQGEASLVVKGASVGLRKFNASVTGSTGPIVVARHGGTAKVQIRQLKSGIIYEAGVVEADVEQLDLAAPQLTASGTLNIQPGLLSARVNVRDANITELGNVALRVAGDVERVKKAVHYFPAGTVPEMSLQSAGRTFAEMVSRENIVLSGVMRNGTIILPASELELQNVSGSVRISQGTLEATNVSAQHGTMRGWNGVLSLGLGGKTAPFHLDVSVRTGGYDLQAVLLKLVRNEIFRAELLKVQNIEGELSGKLVLGERLDGISPVVTLSKADVSATYAPIPFLITIRGGRLNYDQKIIRLENVQGSIGRSNFRELGATFQRGSHQIEVDPRRASLDLHEADALLRSFKELPSQFQKWQPARGRIELDNFTLSGAHDNPAGWEFAAAGRFDDVEVAYAELPERMILSRGKFDAKQGQIKVSGASAAISDAFLNGGGTLEYRKGGAVQFHMSGTGTIGAQMTEWLSRRVNLPTNVKLRAPLKIAARRFTWLAGDALSFRGEVTLAGGPQLSLDVVKRAQLVAVQHLTVRDGDRRARITLQVAKDNLDGSFNGKLMQQTIDKLFASFPMKEMSLQGDIQVNAALAKPVRVTARGELSGSNLLIPVGAEKALIEKFNIEASGQSVQVRSVELRWHESRLTASGRVNNADNLDVDLDVVGDQLDWEELRRSFRIQLNRPRPETDGISSIPAIRGVIRLKTNRFSFERFSLSALELKAAIGSSGIRADIERGVVCGINTRGRIAIDENDIELDLQLTAAEGQLEPATVCITGGNNDIKGTYSLKAQVTGRGDRERLLPSLKGKFEISARDGEFVRAPATDATFDYLNGTGDFKFTFPDLDKETFPYRLVRVKGTIDGQMVVGEEIVVESSALNLSGRAKIDLANKQVDGKAIIAVLKPVDQVLRYVPLLGTIFGGAFLGIPVRVTGALGRPQVTYLAPADVGEELLKIPMRILGIPIDAIKLFTPSDSGGEKNTPE